ncbi:DNA repair protein RadA [Candidatus Saccharibacteria bacterium]|nr:DNA repair protein RadA [Candidatus Saccharibacteria bacterium]
MVKAKTKFVCSNCGASYSKWSGKCAECGQWNTLLEQMVEDSGKSAVALGVKSGKQLKTQSINSIESSERSARFKTGFSQLDEVLGGGILPASVSLLAGQPGIGKSTILLQLASNIAKDAPVLYISGEESAAQVKLRAKRLANSHSENLNFASSTSANDIAATIRSQQYKLVIVDSIQTLSLEEVSSAPGSVSQVTNSGNVLIRAAKSSDTAVMIVGHVTKDGTLAGPKVLEHLVDVVLNFEGDRYGGFKTLRAVKNRFGSTNDIAIFEMDNEGLKPVLNPSQALLAERLNTDGSIVLATIEGTRPILVEIQALVNTTSFGYPKRTASGFDLNRLNLLVAVLQQRTKLNLADKDIYVNVVGGLKLQDPAADLAVCMAIASAASGRKLDDHLIVFGEVGLGGEIRSAHSSERRISEAKKLGFTAAIAPKTAAKGIGKFVLPVADLRSALIKYINK